MKENSKEDTESSRQENLIPELAEKVLQADLKNIVKKVQSGKTLSTAERKIVEGSREAKAWDTLGIHKTSYYKYLKMGMPEVIEEAKDWIQCRAGLQRQGSGKIEIGGREFEASDLIDLRGKVLKGQADNLLLKNRIEKLNVEEREGRLVDVDSLTETLSSILYPLRKALDQMPENIASALNPEDPTRAETILEQELQNIYSDLVKSLSRNEQTKNYAKSAQ